ncbi:hypothetical protein GCM10027444_26230 [Actinopolyspora lacussalsi]
MWSLSQLVAVVIAGKAPCKRKVRGSSPLSGSISHLGFPRQVSRFGGSCDSLRDPSRGASSRVLDPTMKAGNRRKRSRGGVAKLPGCSLLVKLCAGFDPVAVIRGASRRLCESWDWGGSVRLESVRHSPY